MTEEILSLTLPLLAVGALLAGVGRAVETALGDAAWWHRTRALHPILAGLAMGLTRLPVPEAMGSGRVGAVVWYGLAGALAVPLYELARRIVERRAP